MAPPSSPRGLILLAIAVLRCLLVFLRERPHVTFATGGYVSAPAAIASRLLQIPLVLFLPDVVPGRAVAWLAPLATRIAVTTEDALEHLPARKAVVTGYPVRESFAHTSRRQARGCFQLPLDSTVVCVFGGSQGARSLNEALTEALPGLVSRYHVLHICGTQRFEEARTAARALAPEQQARYRLYPYLHDEDMAAALASADLVVCRSGASTLGELPAVGVPAVLVPFPDPAVHQEENAQYLARRGAAVVLPDDQLPDRLGDVLEELLADPARLKQMASACSALARPQAAGTIANLIRQVAA